MINPATLIGIQTVAECATWDPWFPEVPDETATAWGTALLEAKLDLDHHIIPAIKHLYTTRTGGYRPIIGDILAAARELRLATNGGTNLTPTQREHLENELDKRFDTGTRERRLKAVPRPPAIQGHQEHPENPSAAK